MWRLKNDEEQKTDKKFCEINKLSNFKKTKYIAKCIKNLINHGTTSISADFFPKIHQELRIAHKERQLLTPPLITASRSHSGQPQVLCQPQLMHQRQPWRHMLKLGSQHSSNKEQTFRTTDTFAQNTFRQEDKSSLVSKWGFEAWWVGKASKYLIWNES